ncbi:MAG: alpha/beta fold hydrolase, partial [Opitutales bacterium]
MTSRCPPPQSFILTLPDLALECGSVVRRHRAHGWWWSREGDRPDAPASGVPTVLLVHALTGGAQAGGSGGWWEPLLGPGRALDPARHRLLCFNNLGSFYGSSAPGLPGFPRGQKVALGSLDLARAILQGLDELGIRRVQLATGGSLGGMVVLALAALAPGRFERIMPIATTAASSAWVIGWNHVARGILRLDPGYPHHVDRGFEVARQLAMLTYRAEPGLELRHEHAGRAIGGYLEHPGRMLHHRYTAACYESQLVAMDRHVLRRPLRGGRGPALARIRAATLLVDVASDQLFTPAQSAGLVRLLRGHAR